MLSNPTPIVKGFDRNSRAISEQGPRLFGSSEGVVRLRGTKAEASVLQSRSDFDLARNSHTQAVYRNLHETFRSTSDLQHCLGLGERLDRQRLQAR